MSKPHTTGKKRVKGWMIVGKNRWEDKGVMAIALSRRELYASKHDLRWFVRIVPCEIVYTLPKKSHSAYKDND